VLRDCYTVRRVANGVSAFFDGASYLGRGGCSNVRTLSEFLLHGIQYVFVPERGELTRGMPTAHAASVMLDKVVADGEPPPVWPCPEGEVRGIGFSPLHKSAPVAAKQDAAFYDLLALVDVVRAGRARERAIAGRELQKRLTIHDDTKPQH